MRRKLLAISFLRYWFASFAITMILGMHGAVHADSSGDALELLLDKLPKEYEKVRAPVLKKLKTYSDDEARAKQLLRSQLQILKVAANLNKNPLGAADLLKQINDLDTWIRKGGELPKCDFLLEQIYWYVVALVKARNGLEKPLLNVLKKLKNDGRDQDVQDLVQAFDGLGGLLDSSIVLTEGKKFGGSRCAAGAKDQVRIRITVEEVKEKTMSGQIERDHGWAEHPIHGMSGLFNGLEVGFQSTDNGTIRDMSLEERSLANTGVLGSRESVVTAISGSINSNLRPLYFQC